MAAHLHALLRAKLRCRLALALHHPSAGTTHFALHATRPRPPPPPRRHDHAGFFMPARGLAARASKKKKDAATAAAIGGTPLPAPPGAAVAAKARDDAKKADMAAAAKMVTATKKGAAVLDPHIPDDMNKSWHVLQLGNEIYDATLNQTNVGGNNNKFFIIQALESDGGASWMVYWRYGRVGHRGGASWMVY